MTESLHFQLDEYYIDLQQQAQGMEIIDEAETRRNPFPGLRPFRTNEAHLFFGREGQSEELISRLMDTHFLGVLGNSGSGKSSLVRAGLIPALHAGKKQARVHDWKIAICRPGSSPLQNLAAALAGTRLRTTDTALLMPEVQRQLSLLRSSSFGLLEAEGNAGEHEKTLLIIDQFEELFRFARDIPAGEATHFVDLLITAVQQQDANIYVVITMRSEFLGECVHYRGLPEIINQGQYLVPRLTNENLRRAITGPLAVVGAGIQGTLVSRLLRELGDNMDQLPLLQHALMRTYAHWQRQDSGQPIGHADYDATGGIQKALGQHADELYLGLDEAGRAITRLLFQRLTDLTTGDKGGRRPTRMDELYGLLAALPATPAEVDAVIEQFRDINTSFLMPPPGTPLQGETLLDIAHESLIRNWDRLSTWAQEEAENMRLYQRLRQGFAENKKYPQIWISGGPLEDLCKWREGEKPNGYWAARYHAPEEAGMDDWAAHAQLFADNIAFLEACEDREAEEERRKVQEYKKQAEAEAAQKQLHIERELRTEAEAARQIAEQQRALAQQNEERAGRRTRLVVFFLLLALVLAGFAGLFYVDANKERKLAERARGEAEEAQEEAVYAQKEEEKAKLAAEANLAEAKKQEQNAIAATREAEKNFAAAQANLRRAEQEEKRARAALAQVEKEKEATEVQRLLAEKNYERAQAATNDANTERDRAQRALEDLAGANTVVVRLLLQNTVKDILSTNYEQAYGNVQSAAILKAEQKAVAAAALELAFWYGETGNQARSDTMLRLAYASFNKRLDTNQALRDAIESADKKVFDGLMLRYYPLDTVRLAGGTFGMGCKPGRDDVDECYNHEKFHNQSVRGFIVSRHETTWWQYRLFCEAEKREYEAPGWGIQGDNPVVNVSGYDAVEYANWVSVQLGLDVAYTIDKRNVDTNNISKFDILRWIVIPQTGSKGYRLLTEAEWEYAARGGQEEAFAGCNDASALGDYAWYNINTRSRTEAVKGKKPNAYGLYDMSGNVREWCWDWYGEYPVENRIDYRGPITGAYRVYRGGSWGDDPQKCRVAFRDRDDPHRRFNGVGFRLARTP